MKREIPIRNIYYLLSYAWKCIGPGTDDRIGEDSFTNASNLLARLLDICLSDLERRGLSKAYYGVQDEISGIKGRLCVEETLRRSKLHYRKVVCEFEEHGFDHQLNRLIKGCISILLKQEGTSRENVRLLRRHYALLEPVTAITVTPDLFSKIRLSSNNRKYNFTFELCRLIALSLVISSEKNEVNLSNFLNDSVKMERIFESFVKEFYSFHLPGVSVTSPKFQWMVEAKDAYFANMVPELRTDVVITSSHTRLIIDAKFYREALKQSYEGGGFKFHRSHLSQLMDYMRTSQRKLPTTLSGLLLYPSVFEEIDSSGRIEGFEIRVGTVDLSKPWEDIEARMLNLLPSSLKPLKQVA